MTGRDETSSSKVRLRPLGHLEGVPGQPVAGHVGHGVGPARRAEGVAADGVELDHLGDGPVEDRLGTLLPLGGSRHESRPQRLRQDQEVAHPCAGVGQELGRVDQSRDAQAELDLGVAHCVAAEGDRAGQGDPLGGPAEDLGQDLQRELVVGEGRDIQRRDRAAVHGVDVRQGVRRRDPAERVRVVDQRREEIERLDQGEIGREAIHPRVVHGLGADQDVGVELTPRTGAGPARSPKGRSCPLTRRSWRSRSVASSVRTSSPRHRLGRPSLTLPALFSDVRLSGRPSSAFTFAACPRPSMCNFTMAGRLAWPWGSRSEPEASATGTRPGRASGTQDLADLRDQRLLVRKSAGLEFRVKSFAADGELETAPLGRDHHVSADGSLVSGQQLGRQTDGLGLVVSKGTVFESDFHGALLRFNGRPMGESVPSAGGPQSSRPSYRRRTGRWREVRRIPRSSQARVVRAETRATFRGAVSVGTPWMAAALGGLRVGR